MKKNVAAFLLVILFLSGCGEIQRFAQQTREQIIQTGPPDREYLNSETERIAAIYDFSGLFTEEEKDLLMGSFQECTAWCDVYILTADMTGQELNDRDMWKTWDSMGGYVALLYGKSQEDQLVWSTSEFLSQDDWKDISLKARNARQNGNSAYETADSFAENLLKILEKSGSAPDELTNNRSFPGQYYFRTITTLRKILALEADEEITAYDMLCHDYSISEDLTIPSGKTVYFRDATLFIEPGATVTVEENAQLSFCGLEVGGTILNRGNLLQRKASENGTQMPARITGKIINRGLFISYEISEGIEKVENLEGSTFYSKATPEPTQNTPVPVKPVKTAPSDWAIWGIVLFPAVLFMIVILKLKKNTSNQKKQDSADAWERFRNPAEDFEKSADSGFDRIADYSRAEYFEYDKTSRLKQLDVWLKNGLIDRDEYRRLKKRYSENAD